MSPRRLFKVLASALLFATLGLGGLLLSLLICPGLFLLPPRPRRRAGSALIHRSFRGFVRGMEATGILRIETEDLPEASALRGTLLVANHPSWLDVVVLLARLPGCACVVKPAVWANPFFGLLVRTAGFIPARDPEAVLAQGEAILAEGRCLLLFPEGTRTLPGDPLHFQRGAAHLALRSGAPLLPLILTVEPPLLEKGARWYDVPTSTCRYRIRGRQPLAFDPPSPEGPDRVQQARQITERLEAFYHRELHGPHDHTP